MQANAGMNARNASAWEGSELVRRRKALGMTQKALSEKTGITIKLISAYENGRRRPRSENRRLLEQALAGPQLESSLTPPIAHACPDQKTCSWCAFGRALMQGLTTGEVRVNLVWRDESGDLVAIAETVDDGRQHKIRARVARTKLNDLRSVSAGDQRREFDR